MSLSDYVKLIKESCVTFYCGALCGFNVPSLHYVTIFCAFNLAYVILTAFAIHGTLWDNGSVETR
jgi:hypothetical protein